jgi:hypothetical protein
LLLTSQHWPLLDAPLEVPGEVPDWAIANPIVPSSKAAATVTVFMVVSFSERTTLPASPETGIFDRRSFADRKNPAVRLYCGDIEEKPRSTEHAVAT